MERKGIYCSVTVFLEFTDDELDTLNVCSHGHYDGRCKEASEQGGIIYGLSNMGGHRHFSFRELDLLAKILEQPNVIPESIDLRAAIVRELGYIEISEDEIN